ncbi:dihydroxyacetone kinase subunit DhaK [Kribbella sp. NPDC004536]|uniref:dihydroxyacetone kinase subunit DhaK n=1 Tax=Kribbella sp. NPDC004536 TaxID=3364106 RepID=UPI00369F1A35
MTHFLPAADAVTTAARGLALANPGLIELHSDPLYLRATSGSPGRTVALVAGGGSGHEPLHTGLLGAGGLDAVCPGEIFASPHNRQIYEAGTAVAKSNGVLLIVKNYTGDVINFQIAAERLRHDGLPVATVLIDDDLATDNKDTATGRRGTAATVVVEKLLGAAADQGAELDDLATLGAEIVARSRSLAVAARAQTSPATGEPAFTLDAGTLEYGVGIHGERGTGTVERRPVGDLVRGMADDLLAALPAGPEQVLAIVNGLGATTSLELHAIGSILHDELTSRGVRQLAVVPGTFTAALDMAGFSLTLTRMKPEWVELWTGPTTTPLVLPDLLLTETTAQSAVVEASTGPARTDTAPPSRAVLDQFAKLVAQVQDNLTALDQLVGDGDFGDNLAGGVRQAQTLNDAGTDGMTALAQAFLDDVGGTSGPLFGLLFQQLAVVSWPDDDAPDARAVAAAARAGLAAIHRVGGAEVGDCTLVDALAPAIDALDNAASEPFTTAAEAAVRGAAGTASLAPRRGRASYVGDRALGVPDPGALGVALLFTALSRAYEPNEATRLPDPQRLTAH